jgi:hypothetical protein
MIARAFNYKNVGSSVRELLITKVGLLFRRAKTALEMCLIN